MDTLSDILSALEAATQESASPLYFTLVRLRARVDGWTPERQRRYVAALAATGRADRAAALVGMTEQTAARLRRRPDAASFAAACSAAVTLAKQLRRARSSAALAGRAAPAAKGSNGSAGFCA